MAKNWREKLWKTVSKLGGAPSQAATTEDHSKEDLPNAISDMSATEDMVQEDPIVLERLPKFSISVEDIFQSGFMNTGWTATLQSIVEQPSLVSAELLPFEVLPEKVYKKLMEVAEGLGYDPIELIQAIVSHYQENEHEIMETGTVYDAVLLYTENEVL